MCPVCCSLQCDPRWVHPASSLPWTGTAGVCHHAWLALASQRILHISSHWIPLLPYHLAESWEWKASCLLGLGSRCFRWKLIFVLHVPEWDLKEGKFWTLSYGHCFFWRWRGHTKGNHSRMFLSWSTDIEFWNSTPGVTSWLMLFPFF